MPRIQILALPTTGHGDSTQVPFVIVIDQADDHFATHSQEWRRALITEVGARSVLVTKETLDIPANGVPTGTAETDDAKLIDRLQADLDEARSWARHGYEIGQRHCSWSDYGVAPAWLTDGWPSHFDSCEHLTQAAAYDTALSGVRSLPEQPEAGDSNNPYSGDYLRGYAAGVKNAKSAARLQPATTDAPSED